MIDWRIDLRLQVINLSRLLQAGYNVINFQNFFLVIIGTYIHILKNDFVCNLSLCWLKKSLNKFCSRKLEKLAVRYILTYGETIAVWIFSEQYIDSTKDHR